MTTLDESMPFWPANVSQPSAAVNQALQWIYALMFLLAENTDLTSAPTTTEADAGKCWIVGPTATGVWSGKDGMVAICTGADLWHFLEPKEGWLAKERGGNRLEFDGAAWGSAGGGGTGDVVGPASAVADRIATYNGTTGKLVKDGGKTIAEVRAPTIKSTVTSNTITPDGDSDLIRPAALSANLTIANPAANPADGWGMVLELKDNGTSRALTWGSKYTNRCANLPTATTAGKQHVIGFSYNAADDKLYCDYALVQP